MTYDVKPNGTKLLDEFRGDRIYGNCFVIIKNGREEYEVITSTLGDMCNCLAGQHGKNCKHLQMVYDYQAKVN
jgi:hypothetical protein